MPGPPTVAETLKSDPPLYVRKVDRSGYGALQQDGNEDEDFVNKAVDKIFGDQEPEHSIFLIRNDDDLRRVAIAYNANRSSLVETIFFMVLRGEELQSSEIQVETSFVLTRTSFMPTRSERARNGMLSANGSPQRDESFPVAPKAS